ncbi:hypothetical protein Tsubulata_000310 [Turnera subulata]|uniref:Jasmonate O-methyltransferase n=1 Tax=Turnera subulata TaxID=218843 RepID=A0A9Q0F0N1_9ROSI|nr:hypothetical protein Tsubulata_000310 [Turnera subulata]
MDVGKNFHMTGGLGENSYANNCTLQKKASHMVKHILEALQGVYLSLAPKSIGIADLGCSSGHNSLSTVKDILEAIEAAGGRVPPALYDEQGKSINKGSICICESSPPLVSQAYYEQFQGDFSLFLQTRSQEVVSGGCMVLILLGRIGQNHVDRGNSFFWQLLAKSFSILVSKGEIQKEDLDSYELPFYAPCKDEIEGVIRRDGSFELNLLQMFETNDGSSGKDGESYGTSVANTVRAVQEPMISHHFGDGILDTLTSG